MRKLYLLKISLPVVLLMNACKKSDVPSGEEINPQDAVAVSKAIRVWHGVRTAGSPPPPNTGGPVLYANTDPVTAANGRYAIIRPEISSGDVQGYYLRVNGAPEYFNIDYSKPRQLERQRTTVRKSVHNKALYKAFKIDSTGTGIADSSIVITIPSSIQAGQFCLTYYAYDSLGNCGNPVTVCVNVVSFGGDNYFAGNWHLVAQSYDTTMGWEQVYGYADTVMGMATCVNGQVVDTFSSGPGVFNYPIVTYNITKSDLKMGANGGMTFEYSDVVKDFDYLNSTCSNFVYHADQYEDIIHGAWSFNAAGNKLTLIFEFDDNGVPQPEAWEFTAKKIHPNRFYLYDTWDDSWLKFEK